jgi:FBP C-terminal treble-clef zinc-finger
MVAPRAGQRGDSIGSCTCDDFGCSLYIRGRRDPGLGGGLPETISTDHKIERLLTNVTAFVDRVTAL